MVRFSRSTPGLTKILNPLYLLMPKFLTYGFYIILKAYQTVFQLVKEKYEIYPKKLLLLWKLITSYHVTQKLKIT